MRLAAVVLVLLPALSQGFILDSFVTQSNWNGLKVTWGVNPLHSFSNMPRTKDDAEKHGWARLAAQDTCDSSSFRGIRYFLNNDEAVVLIYDVNGYIAGIQIGVSKNISPNPNNWPFQKQIGRPYVLEGNTYYVTAYFVDPSTVCTGRTAAQFHTEGTGNGLWIQNGSNPVTQSMQIPMTVAEADKSMWTKGSCFATMGLHYWYNTAKTMHCEDFYPMFLLYNGGVLNAFGWAMGVDVSSPRLEHPPEGAYGTFMNPVPDCLHDLGTLTTLHIYLTNSVITDDC